MNVIPAVRKRRPFTAIGVAVVLALCSCQADTSGTDDGVDLEHIHALGMDPQDGTLYAAGHHGLFRVSGREKPEQVAGRTQDFMGFTVIGAGHFLGSGHPGPGDEDQPANLGLIESKDAGDTWRSLSLSGVTDFHAMEAKHGQVYGFDSQTSQILVSEDKKSWDKRSSLALADIAVAPDDAEEILATTEQGIQRSTDAGRGFSPTAGSPTLIFIDWVASDRLVGIDQNSAIHVSEDRGASWVRKGSVDGQPQAVLAHGDADVYVATNKAIYRSRDGGRTFVTLQQL